MRIWWWFEFTSRLLCTASNWIGTIGSGIHYFWLSFLVCYFISVWFMIDSLLLCCFIPFTIAIHCVVIYVTWTKTNKTIYIDTIYWQDFIAIVALGCTCVTLFSTFFIELVLHFVERIRSFSLISFLLRLSRWLKSSLIVTHSLCHKSHGWKTVASTCSQQTNRFELRGYGSLRLLRVHFFCCWIVVAVNWKLLPYRDWGFRVRKRKKWKVNG